MENRSIVCAKMLKSAKEKLLEIYSILIANLYTLGWEINPNKANYPGFEFLNRL